MSNLQGEYQFTNYSMLRSVDTQMTFIISNRHKESVHKPKSFLLRVLPSGGRQYVSSLFPCPKWPENGLQTYTLDWQGKTYLLTLDRDNGKASISQLPENCTSRINNVQLGAKIAPK